jgi:hypothetical protein
MDIFRKLNGRQSPETKYLKEIHITVRTQITSPSKLQPSQLLHKRVLLFNRAASKENVKLFLHMP